MVGILRSAIAITALLIAASCAPGTRQETPRGNVTSRDPLGAKLISLASPYFEPKPGRSIRPVIEDHGDDWWVTYIDDTVETGMARAGGAEVVVIDKATLKIVHLYMSQ